MSAVRQVAEGAAGPQATPWCAGRESSRSPPSRRAAVAGCRGCGARRAFIYQGSFGAARQSDGPAPLPAGRAADVSRNVVTHGGGHGMGQGRRGAGADDEQGPKRFD